MGGGSMGGSMHLVHPRGLVLGDMEPELLLLQITNGELAPRDVALMQPTQRDVLRHSRGIVALPLQHKDMRHYWTPPAAHSPCSMLSTQK